MIFVTVGGSSSGFSRLIKKMDDITESIENEVVMQIGKTDYKPENSKFFDYVSKEEIEKYYRKANIIVGHAGIGTIISSYKYKTQIIIVPRRKEYDEHFDDHQMEIAKRLEEEGIGIVIYDVDDLESAIKSVKGSKINSLDREKSLVKNLKKYLDKLEEK